MSQNGVHEGEEGIQSESSNDDSCDSSDERSTEEHQQCDKDKKEEGTFSPNPETSSVHQRPPIPAVRRRVPSPCPQEASGIHIRREINPANFKQRLPLRGFRGRHNRPCPRRQAEKSCMDFSDEYDSDNGMSPHEKSQQHVDKNFRAVSPERLIRALVSTPNLQASLLQLAEIFSFHPTLVRQLTSDFSYIFKRREDHILLQPDVAICDDHLGESGCKNRSVCNGLHICQRYLADLCGDNRCLFGHKLNTNHNTKILNFFRIGNLPSEMVKIILRSSVSYAETQKHLDICQEYNVGKCTRLNCNFLHICREFVAGSLRCSIQHCSLNHNLLSSDCRWLLDRQGINTNEAPRDILANLLEENPSLGKLIPLSDTSSETNISRTDAIEVNSMESGINMQSFHKRDNENEISAANTESVNNSSDTSDNSSLQSDNDISQTSPNFSTNDIENITNSSGLGKFYANNNSNTSTSLSSACGADRKSDQGSLNSATNMDPRSLTNNDETSCDAPDSADILRPNILVENSRSQWSHYLEGDVSVPEICYDSVENTCPEESKGCPKLHSTRHFHWQVSEENYFWLNLLPSHVLSLERSFCNPGIDVTTIPALREENLDPARQILLLLMGEDTWQANFQGMILINSDDSRILYLRRLRTEIIPGLPVEQSIYHWFYCNSEGIWIEYGDTTAGEDVQSDYINSEAIESQYMINPTSLIQFSIAGTEYNLDFSTMTQTNTNTQEIQNVRRRPKPHLPYQRNIFRSQQRPTESSNDSSEERSSD
ncbi:hypothetical protein SK128_009948 [Halocaridina rubra]|uniref:WWE domain-containing protein n=1 Tax=Halocaridina rubra TaxID=373956 RepID=A0AAN8XAQ4_HALRR